MGRVALAIAYDGTDFDSYARQPGHRTVEGELITLLRAERILPPHGTTRFQSGSRTDRGVSAAWNVVAFDTDAPAGSVMAAAPRAPPGVALLSSAPVDEAFNPRHASRRTYAYLLPPSWAFDWKRARPVAERFAGEHDFTNFSRPEPHRDPVRRIDGIRYRPSPKPARVEITGPSFAWQEVRRVLAALRGVSEGRIAPDAVHRALARPGERVDLGIAPPENLILVRVDYDHLRFPGAPRAARSRVAHLFERAGRAAFVYGTALAMTPSRRR